MKKTVNLIQSSKAVFLPIFILVILFSTTSVLANPQSQQSNPDCTPIDLVILLDQSDDMKKIDPDNLRFSYVSNIISMLGLEHMAHCSRTPNEISVISFGGTYPGGTEQVAVDIPMTVLAPSKREGIASWQNQVAGLSDKIILHEGWTGRAYESAFEHAIEQLHNGQNDKKMILVISSFYGSPKSDIINLPLEAKNSIVDLGNSILSMKDDLDDLYIYSIALRPDSPSQIQLQFQNYVEPAWKQILKLFSGEYATIQNSHLSNIGHYAVSMIGEVSPSFRNYFQSGQCNSLYLNPLTDEFASYIFQDTLDTQVEIKSIESNQSQELVNDNPRHSFVYVEKDPFPGEWRVEGACSNFWFYAASVYYTVEAVVEPVDKSIIPQCDQVKFECNETYLKVRLDDHNGDPIPLNSNHLPYVEGVADGFNLTFWYADDGWFLSHQEINTNSVQTHVWDVEVFSPEMDPDNLYGDKSLLSVSGDYRVDNVTPIDIEIIEPKPNSRIQLFSSIFSGLDPQDVEVKIRITDEFGDKVLNNDGRLLTTEELFDADFENDIKVILTNKDTLESSTTSFEFSQSENQVMVANLGNELLEPGTYSVLLQFPNSNIESLDTQFMIIRELEGREVEVRRVCGVFNCPVTVTILQVTGLTLLILAIGIAIFLFINPIRGSLKFSPRIVLGITVAGVVMVAGWYFLRPNGVSPEATEIPATQELVVVEATHEPTLIPTPIPTAVPVAWRRLNSLQFIPRDLVTVILEDPTDQDVWYAGTSNAGIYKTINGGASWAPFLEGLSSANVDTLVIDPIDPNTLYAGLIYGGVSKTTDGGNTWFAVNNGIQEENRGQLLFKLEEVVSAVVISPLDTQHLYFTNGHKVYETRDGGGFWTEKYSFNKDYIKRLVIHPENDNTLFMATIDFNVNGKVWKSEDSGNSWVELFEDDNNKHWRTDLWVDHVNGDLIYFIAGGNRLYISQDGGLTWNSVASLENEMGISFGTPWVGEAAFVLKGEALYQTTDSGSTWTRVGKDITPFIVGDLEVSAQDNSLVYLGTSGVYVNRLDNQGWIDKSVGLGGVKISLYLDPSNNNSFYMTGTGDKQGDLFASEDGGINWELRSGSEVWENRASFTVAGGDVLYQLQRNTLVSSVDKGKTWSEFGGIQGGFSLFVNPYQSDIFVVGRYFELPVVSHDHGGTWEEIISEVDGVYKMAFVKNQPDLMYVLAEDLARSEDGGVTWDRCGDFDEPWWPSQGEPMGIVDPRDGNHLLVATWDGIISTFDGCRTWQYSNNGLYSLKVNSISADPNNPDTIYAGTDNGAYVSFDSGDLWQPINDGLLGGLVIYSIVVDIDSNVYATTPLGVFQLEAQ